MKPIKITTLSVKDQTRRNLWSNLGGKWQVMLDEELEDERVRKLEIKLAENEAKKAKAKSVRQFTTMTRQQEKRITLEDRLFDRAISDGEASIRKFLDQKKIHILGQAEIDAIEEDELWQSSANDILSRYE